CRLARWLFAVPRRAQAPLLDRSEALDARALATLVQALDELAELGVALSGTDLVALLDELAIEASGSGGEDEVWLAQPLQIRARRFRVVFVCGLQEGGFPLPATPEPFLSEERGRELASASGLLLHAGEDALD